MAAERMTHVSSELGELLQKFQELHATLQSQVGGPIEALQATLSTQGAVIDRLAALRDAVDVPPDFDTGLEKLQGWGITTVTRQDLLPALKATKSSDLGVMVGHWLGVTRELPTPTTVVETLAARTSPAPLRNIGATCFLNALVQVLHWAPGLGEYLSNVLKQEAVALSRVEVALVRHLTLAGSDDQLTLLNSLALSSALEHSMDCSGATFRLGGQEDPGEALYRLSNDGDLLFGLFGFQQTNRIEVPDPTSPVRAALDFEGFLLRDVEREPQLILMGSDKVTPGRVAHRVQDMIPVSDKFEDIYKRRVEQTMERGGFAPHLIFKVNRNVSTFRKQTMRVDISKLLRFGDTVFQLYGVVIHLGATPDSGHYVAVVHGPGGWFRCDDSTISKVDDLVGWVRSDEAQMNSAYLFYERLSGGDDTADPQMLALDAEDHFPYQEPSPPPPPCDSNSPHQTWVLVPVGGDGVYLIQSVDTARCVDVHGVDRSAGAVLCPWESHQGENQQWRAEPATNGGGWFLNCQLSPGNAMEASVPTTGLWDGVSLFQNNAQAGIDSPAAHNQVWYFEHADSGKLEDGPPVPGVHYRIRNGRSVYLSEKGMIDGWSKKAFEDLEASNGKIDLEVAPYLAPSLVTEAVLAAYPGRFPQDVVGDIAAAGGAL